MTAGPSTLIGLRLRYTGPLMFSDAALQQIWDNAEAIVRQDCHAGIRYPAKSKLHREKVYEIALAKMQALEEERP